MAFKPRSRTTFGIPQKNPASEVILDSRSFVRQAPISLRDKSCSSTQQRLWIDVTDLDTTNIESIDDEYNSNMWKNFKFVRSKASAGSLERKSGTSTSRERIILPVHKKPNVNKDPHVRRMIADTYPLKIPKPSSIGQNTYDKFLNEAKLREEKKQIIGLQLSKNQGFQNRVLKIRSECRAPPINLEGEIVPPIEYKKYPHKAIDFIDEAELDVKPLSYVAQTTRPYAGSPESDFRPTWSPWRQGVKGYTSHRDYNWTDRL